MLNPSSNTGAYVGMAPTSISSANINGGGLMLNESAKYTANTGMVSIATANSNLDGSGTLGTVLTAAANGTLIKSIRIEALASPGTNPGMIRLYVQNTGGIKLIWEVEVPPKGRSAVYPAWSKTLDVNFNLQANALLVASTQNAQTFIVTAEGLDWAY